MSKEIERMEGGPLVDLRAESDTQLKIDTYRALHCRTCFPSMLRSSQHEVLRRLLEDFSLDRPEIPPP